MKAILTWMWNVLGLNRGQDTDYTNIFREIPQSLQTIARYLKLGHDRFQPHHQWAKCVPPSNFRNTKIKMLNSTNNYFIRIRTKTFFRNMLHYWKHTSYQAIKVISIPHKCNYRATWQMEGKWNYLYSLSLFRWWFITKATQVRTY